MLFKKKFETLDRIKMIDNLNDEERGLLQEVQILERIEDLKRRRDELLEKNARLRFSTEETLSQSATETSASALPSPPPSPPSPPPPPPPPTTTTTTTTTDTTTSHNQDSLTVETTSTSLSGKKNNSLASFISRVDNETWLEEQRTHAKNTEVAKRAPPHKDRKTIDHTNERVTLHGEDAAKKKPMLAVTFRNHYNKLSTDDKKVIIHDPIKLTITCECCNEYVRSDNIHGHCDSSKHKRKRDRWNALIKKQATLRDFIERTKSLSRNVHTDEHMMRLDWTRRMLIANVPIEKSNDFREFLETWTKHDLTDSSHLLRDYLEIIQNEELELIRSEVKGRKLRISFDETTINWCCFCVVVGFVDDQGWMQQRVVRLGMYLEAPEESITNTMSSLVIVAISEILQVRDTTLIKVFTRDGVAINELAIKKLIGGEVRDPNRGGQHMIVFPAQYPSAFDIKCFSHTLDNCGGTYTQGGVTYSRLEGIELRAFYIHLNGLFSSASNAPNNSWLLIMGTSMPSVSGTRWWSKEELYEYVLAYFEHRADGRSTIMEWVERAVTNKILEGSHITYLHTTLCQMAQGHDAGLLRLIYIQLAVVVDVSRPIREATYLLEGDGPLCFLVSEILQTCSLSLSDRIDTMDFPNIKRLIDKFTADGHRPPDPTLPLQRKNDCKEAWIQYCRVLADPCYRYFNDKVMNHPALELYNATLFGNPQNMANYPCSARDLRQAVAPLVPKLIEEGLVDRMVQQLAAYKMVADVAKDWGNFTYQERLKCIEKFWTVPRKNMEAWQEFAWTCMLLQPSSACVERAFSILKYILTDQQFHSLQDKIETSLMLRFNRRARNELDI